MSDPAELGLRSAERGGITLFQRGGPNIVTHGKDRVCLLISGGLQSLHCTDSRAGTSGSRRKAGHDPCPTLPHPRYDPRMAPATARPAGRRERGRCSCWGCSPELCCWSGGGTFPARRGTGPAQAWKNRLAPRPSFSRCPRFPRRDPKSRRQHRCLTPGNANGKAGNGFWSSPARGHTRRC